MKSNSEIQKKVKDTFDAVSSIEKVNVSPFFKEKVMQQIRNASNDTEVVSNPWFTPSLQFATLIVLVALNVIAYMNINNSNYETNIEEFAETYGLSSDTETINFN